MKAAVVALVFLLSTSCTSGLFAEEALEPVAGAELLQLQDVLRQGVRAQTEFFVENSRYATTAGELGLSVPPEVTVTITPQAAEGFCMSGTHSSQPDVVWHVTAEQTVPVEGPC